MLKTTPGNWIVRGTKIRNYQRIIGDKRYELSNHLGNVLSVISDHKAISSEDGILTHSTTFANDSDIAPWYVHPLTSYIELEKDWLLVASKHNLNGIGATYTLEANKTYLFSFNLRNDTEFPIEFGISYNNRKQLVELIERREGHYEFKFKPSETGIYTLNINMRIKGGKPNETLEKEQIFYIQKFNIENISDRNTGLTLNNLTFIPEVLSYNDYYPFGMTVPNRSYSSPAYRYGFNGMEKDDDVKGSGNSYDFGARMYDPRVGRWFKTDVLEVKYPYESPYSFVLNMPITAIDPDGKDVVIILVGNGNGENEDAANTRKREIENSSGFDSSKDKVYIIHIEDLNSLKTQIQDAVDDANNNAYGKTIELSYYGHGGVDGPVGNVETTGANRLSKETGDSLDSHQLTIKGWSDIDFNFDEDLSIAAFYGCQTAGFAEKFSMVSNVTYSAGFGGKTGASEDYDYFNANWFTIGEEDIYFMDGQGVIMYQGLGDTKPLYKIWDASTNTEVIIDFTNPNERYEHSFELIKNSKETLTNFSTNVYVEKNTDLKNNVEVKGHKLKDAEFNEKINIKKEKSDKN